MFDASIALGIMTFNALGSVLIVGVVEYVKTRRELTQSQEQSNETAVAHGTPQYATQA